VERVSVFLSVYFSQLNLRGWQHTVALTSLLPTISAGFASNLADVFSLIHQQNQNALEVAVRVFIDFVSRLVT